MKPIKITQDTLNKAIYEGVAEAMLPDSNEYAESNEILDNMVSEFDFAGEKFVRVGEHLSQNIVPEIKTLYDAGLSALKKAFGKDLNFTEMKSFYGNDNFTARIPVVSLEGYKSYLVNEKHYLNEVLKEFAGEYTNYEGELTSENYEQIKGAFLSNEEWLTSSTYEALEKLEEDINGRYSTVKLTYSKSYKEAWLEIEFPYDIEKYCKFINGED